MRVCIHQPTYLPYLGFFDKILSSELFVIYDTAQFSKDKWDNRNKIKINDEAVWLTIPIKKESWFKAFNQVKINNNIPWKEKHWKSIEINYLKASFFDDYKEYFKKIYSKEYEKLIDINIDIIKTVLKLLDCDIKIIKSSELDINQNLSSTDTLISILKTVNATNYLSGSGGKDYIEEEKFKEKKIKLEFQNFVHPTYNQLGKTFIPNLSIIDLLLNEGTKSKEILLSQNGKQD